MKPEVSNRGNVGTIFAVPFGMSSGHTVTTKSSDQHVEVTLDGTVIAASDHPVLLDETGLPTRYYLPRSDVKTELKATTFHTTCPFKGEASYWSAEVDGTAYDGLAWSYETPNSEASEIAGLVSFDPEKTKTQTD